MRVMEHARQHVAFSAKEIDNGWEDGRYSRTYEYYCDKCNGYCGTIQYFYHDPDDDMYYDFDVLDGTTSWVAAGVYHPRCVPHPTVH